MYNRTIGVYHLFPANRSAMIVELEDKQMNFRCEEIEHYKKMKDAVSDIIVIFSPEFLPNKVSITGFKRFLKKLDKTLIIVAYDVSLWSMMNRSKTFYLKQRDDITTIHDVKKILIMEMMGKGKNIVLESLRT